MLKTTTLNKLTQLNYSPKWLESGILTEDMLAKQIEELNQGKDTNTEHYRYGVIRDYLQNRENIDDRSLAHVLELMLIDSDQSMSSSILIGLLKKRTLTDEQFVMVVDSVKTYGNWTFRHIEKAQAARSNPLTDV